VMQHTKTFYPNVLAGMCHREGVLLLAMLGPGTVGETIYDESVDMQVKTKVGFGRFYDLIDTGDAIIPSTSSENNQSQQDQRPPTDGRSPPVTAPAQQNPTSYVYIAGDQIIQQHDEYTFMYPTSGAHIKIRKMSSLNGDNAANVTITHTSHTITFATSLSSPVPFFSPRPTPYFTASFRDGSVFSIKQKRKAEDKESAEVGCMISTQDGLSVEFSKEGYVVQRVFDGQGKGVDGLDGVEVGRVVLSDGTILKYLSNNSTQIFYPNGNITTHEPRTNTWTSTDHTGRRVTTTPGSDAITTQLQIATEKDPASGRVVVTREDMVTVTRSEGRIVTHHSDGTRIETSGEGVEVWKEG
ncbi:hypothetical protein HK097_006449, partial [Rhizophlyctis rosea]